MRIQELTVHAAWKDELEKQHIKYSESSWNNQMCEISSNLKCLTNFSAKCSHK